MFGFCNSYRVVRWNARFLLFAGKTLPFCFLPRSRLARVAKRRCHTVRCCHLAVKWCRLGRRSLRCIEQLSENRFGCLGSWHFREAVQSVHWRHLGKFPLACDSLRPKGKLAQKHLQSIYLWMNRIWEEFRLAFVGIQWSLAITIQSRFSAIALLFHISFTYSSNAVQCSRL